jgi:hypothetical protein
MSNQAPSLPEARVVSCTQCGTKSPSSHAFCSSCGTALATERHVAASIPATKQRNLKQDVAEVRTVGFWVALVVTLPTLSVPALAEKLLDPGQLGVAEARSLWEVFSLTAPLTAAFAIFGVSLLRDWFENTFTWILFSAGIIAATTVIANALSFGAGVSIIDVLYASRFSPVNFVQNMVASYYAVYGFWSFMSSLVLGGFLAWIWAEKVLPYLHAKT